MGIEAEKEASVAKIQYERKISEKQSLKQMAKIEDEMHLDKEKSRTDAEYYRIKRDSEANALLLTKEYLELRKYEALSSNRKIYFGPNIPNVYFGNDGTETGDGKRSQISAVYSNSGKNEKMCIENAFMPKFQKY